jgi:hypothetical protein
VKKPSKIPFVILCLLIVIIIGGYQLIEADYDFSILLSFKFWQDILIMQFANIMIIWGKSKLDIDTYIVTDKDVIDKTNKIKEVVNSSVENDIDDYLSQENKKRKIKVWKNKINNKTIKLDKRAKIKDKELYKLGKEEEKQKNRYCRKKTKLEKYISDEWIEKNIQYLKVKYIPLRRYEITTGANQKEEYYRLTGNISGKILKDSIPRLLISLSMLLIFLSIQPELSDFSIGVLFMITVKLFSITYNFMLARDYAKNFIPTIYLSDLQYRRDVLADYLSWKLKNKKVEIKGGVNNDTVTN